MAEGWLVYLLRCADGSLYCGITADLERRLATHRAGRGSRYVASRLPVEVVYAEPAEGHGEALRRERAIKAMPRAEKLRLVAGAAQTGGGGL